MKNNKHNARKKKVQARKSSNTSGSKTSLKRFEEKANQSISSLCLQNIAKGNIFFAATNEASKTNMFGWLYPSILDEVIEEHAEDWSSITNTQIRLAILEGLFAKASNATTAEETSFYQHLYYGAWFLWGDFTDYTHIGLTIYDDRFGYEELSDFKVIELHEWIVENKQGDFRHS